MVNTMVSAYIKDVVLVMSKSSKFERAFLNRSSSADRFGGLIGFVCEREKLRMHILIWCRRI